MIADAVLATKLLNAEVRRPLPDLINALLDPRSMSGIAKIQLFDPQIVLLLRELLVEHAVLLFEECDAAEAVRTTEAVLAETTIAAVSAVLTVIRHVANGTVDALRTPLALEAEHQTVATDTLT